MVVLGLVEIDNGSDEKEEEDDDDGGKGGGDGFKGSDGEEVFEREDLVTNIGPFGIDSALDGASESALRALLLLLPDNEEKKLVVFSVHCWKIVFSLGGCELLSFILKP